MVKSNKQTIITNTNTNTIENTNENTNINTNTKTNTKTNMFANRGFYNHSLECTPSLGKRCIQSYMF